MGGGAVFKHEGVKTKGGMWEAIHNNQRRESSKLLLIALKRQNKASKKKKKKHTRAMKKKKKRKTKTKKKHEINKNEATLRERIVLIFRILIQMFLSLQKKERNVEKAIVPSWFLWGGFFWIEGGASMLLSERHGVVTAPAGVFPLHDQKKKKNTVLTASYCCSMSLPLQRKQPTEPQSLQSFIAYRTVTKATKPEN